ncbi:hypothetical protein [Spirillospora sp. NPDC047279]|uniref:hypothetical protein n=1 Tax=Spirillospora sp. NPDC047279 TaxID=3155478 RepID=UPI003408E591
MAGKRAAVVATVQKIDVLRTPKRIGVMIAAFVVLVGLLELALLQLGHLQVPLPTGQDGAAAGG